MDGQQEALTAEDVAALLKVNKNTVYALAKDGSLASYRVGRKLRFSLDDVQTYIGSTKRGAQNTPARRGSRKTSEALQSKQVAFNEPFSLNNQETESSSSDYVIGGSDMLLDVMSNHLLSLGFACNRRYTNTYQALVEMYFGLVDAAAISLWDGSSNSYNIPYIKRMLPGLPVRVFHVASYTQGFLIKKGNPKKLRRWSDLLLPGIRLANREKGSSARVLLDEHLRMLEADAHAIDGYSYEVSSPVLQASLIAQREADIGIGSEYLSHQVPGIDYLPHQDSQLVLVVSKKPQTEHINRVIGAYLSNKIFEQELSGSAGYSFEHMGDCIYES